MSTINTPNNLPVTDESNTVKPHPAIGQYGDATIPRETRPKGLAADESRVVDRALGGISGASSPAQSIPEKNISADPDALPPGTVNGDEAGTPAPVPGEGVLWTNGDRKAYLLLDGFKVHWFHRLADASQAVLDAASSESPLRWMDPAAPLVGFSPDWHPVGPTDVIYDDEPTPPRDDVSQGTYTGGAS